MVVGWNGSRAPTPWACSMPTSLSGGWCYFGRDSTVLARALHAAWEWDPDAQDSPAWYDKDVLGRTAPRVSDTTTAVDAVKTVLQGAEHPIVRIRTQLVSAAVEHGAAQAPPSLLLRAAVELAASDPEVAATVATAFDSIRADYTACIAARWTIHGCTS